MEINFTLNQIDSVATQILSAKPNKVILFNGPMGAGKTTLIKALSRALGIFDATSSPTFSLVNEYESASGEKVYHFDVYRLKSEAEALDFGIDEYLDSGDWCFIEWAEKIPSLLPKHYSVVNLSVQADQSRKLNLLNL